MAVECHSDSAAGHRPGSRIGGFAIAGTVLYALFYLYSLGDIDIQRVDWTISFVGEAHLWRQRAPLHFEAVGIAEMGWIVWLISPPNLFIALTLSILLGLNIHGALFLHGIKVCRGGRQTTRLGLSAIPAVIAGGACCAPGILILLGTPTLSGLVSLSGWLVPLSFLMLLLNRVWQRRHGAVGVLTR